MTIHSRLRDAGFTLIELLIVILIIGILAAVAVPNYIKSIETTKADDAVALVNMIGTTNRMYALDHSGAYVVGSFPASGGCGAAACPATGPYLGCTLVGCKYLADQNFGSKPYTFYACNGSAAGVCAAGDLARATRRVINGSPPAPYSGWGYGMNASGVITGYGTSVPTPQY